MPTSPGTAGVERALTLLVNEVKAAQKAESRVGSRHEAEFESGKIQALAFSLQVFLFEARRAGIESDRGGTYKNAQKLVEDQGFGDFDLEDGSVT